MSGYAPIPRRDPRQPIEDPPPVASDRQRLAQVALKLLNTYGHDRDCDHYHIGEDIVDHFDLLYYSTEKGYFNEAGDTLVDIAEGRA